MSALLELNADTSITTKHLGYTALHKAVVGNHIEIATMLLQACASTEIQCTVRMHSIVKGGPWRAVSPGVGGWGWGVCPLVWEQVTGKTSPGVGVQLEGLSPSVGLGGLSLGVGGWGWEDCPLVWEGGAGRTVP